MRDQTNILCLAGYLSFSTGTFPNWQRWWKAGAAIIIWVLLSRWETEESSTWCYEKELCGWESLVYNWSWLKFHYHTQVKKYFVISSNTLPTLHTHTSHYRLNEQCKHLPFTCTARGFWHVKSVDTLAQLRVGVECARMQAAAIRIRFRGVFKRILAWPSSEESGKCQKYNCNDNLVFFLLKTAARAT